MAAGRITHATRERQRRQIKLPRKTYFTYLTNFENISTWYCLPGLQIQIAIDMMSNTKRTKTLSKIKIYLYLFFSFMKTI